MSNNKDQVKNLMPLFYQNIDKITKNKLDRLREVNTPEMFQEIEFDFLKQFILA